MSVKEIVELAESLGWEYLLGKNQVLLIFRRYAPNGTRQKVEVYYTTRTVATSLKHPKLGKSQLFRRNVTDEELREIFQNPRTHTGKGYHNQGTLATQRQKKRRAQKNIERSKKQHERRIRRSRGHIW